MAELPGILLPEHLTAVCDTREQTPLDLSPLRVERDGLQTGDYSIRGLEDIVSVERKSLPDLLACVGRERERFERELHRLAAYPVRLLVIESTWATIEAGNFDRSQVTSSAAMGSLLGWMAQGIPVVMTGNHEQAGRMVSRFLFLAARRRYREARQLAGMVTGGKKRGKHQEDDGAREPKEATC